MHPKYPCLKNPEHSQNFPLLLPMAPLVAGKCWISSRVLQTLILSTSLFNVLTIITIIARIVIIITMIIITTTPDDWSSSSSSYGEWKPWSYQLLPWTQSSSYLQSFPKNVTLYFVKVIKVNFELVGWKKRIKRFVYTVPSCKAKREKHWTVFVMFNQLLVPGDVLWGK